MGTEFAQLYRRLAKLPEGGEEAVSHWPGLLKLAADRSDDNLEDCRNLPTERATRHRYSSQDNEWVTDTVEVRLQASKLGKVDAGRFI